MKRSFTYAFIFSLLFITGRANAQYWLDVGADSTELSYYDWLDNGIGQFQVGPTGKLYYFTLPYAYNEFPPPPLTAQTYDGSHWIHVDPPIQNVYSFKTAVDGASNIYMGVSTDTGVTVYKYNNASWSLFANGPGTSIQSFAVTSGGIPYYATSNGLGPAIYKWNGAAFTSIDTTGLGVGGPWVQLKFDRQDSLYVTYVQAPASGQLIQFYVRKYTGSGWQPVGSPLLSTAASEPLDFDRHNVPYVTGATGTSSTGYSIQLEKLSGGNWTPVGPTLPTAPDFGSSSQYGTKYPVNAGVQVRIGVADTPYVAFNPTTNPDTFYIYADKFDGTAWKPMAANMINLADDPPASYVLATDSAGHPYIQYEGTHEEELRIMSLSSTSAKPTAFISFPSSPIVGIYGQDFAPGAISTNTDSADSITYTIADTTIATIVNGKVHPLNVGTTTITANQAADSNFLAAMPATVGLVIVPGYQQLAFPGIPEKKVGDSDFHALAYTNGGSQLVFSGSDSTIAIVHPDGLIHIRGMGMIIVTVYAEADSLYQATGTLSQILNIQPADSTTGGSGSDSAVAKGMTAFVRGGMIMTTVSVPAAQQARLQLFNSVGRLVYNQEVDLAAGSNQFQLPVGNDRHGIYYLRCAGNGLQLIQSIWIP